MADPPDPGTELRQQSSGTEGALLLVRVVAMANQPVANQPAANQPAAKPTQLHQTSSDVEHDREIAETLHKTLNARITRASGRRASGRRSSGRGASSRGASNLDTEGKIHDLRTGTRITLENLDTRGEQKVRAIYPNSTTATVGQYVWYPATIAAAFPINGEPHVEVRWDDDDQTGTVVKIAHVRLLEN